MHLTRRRPAARPVRWGLAVLSVLGLVGLGVSSPALATPHAARKPVPAAKPQTLTGKPAAERVCGGPRKGEATCFALRRTDVGGATGLFGPNDAPRGFGPADLQSAYTLPANGGAGQTVAIVDAYDDPSAEADLAIYRQQYGLPACTTANGCFKKVDQRGGTSYPTGNTDWAGEISLDVDMVSAAAPNAHILLVEADSPSFENLGVSVNTAVALGARYVSNSYGTNYNSTPGSGEDADELQYDDQYYKHPGVAVVASSGDSDYGVSYPAASQYVTSVGGTALAKDSSTRGWTESVWHNSYGGPGSGCSQYEPKPALQHDSGCTKRAVADVSAVSDPLTGVAVYQTYGGSGWAVYGGTSAASPIIASVYAAAGTPAAGSYPNAYPYANAGALNDVTQGLNGTCTPTYLCTAGTGFDGPTGLGTPNGLAAFRTGPHGAVAGTVTDAGTGKGIAEATVKIGDNSATTDAAGRYTLSVPTGTYQLTAAAYGYGSRSVDGVVVADGGTVSQNFALAAVPRVTVSGTVTDASGHGWPLYARITADGVPGGPVYTDPATGRYSMELPQGASYQLHTVANFPGYQQTDSQVAVGSSDVTSNIGVKADPKACTAPGYQVKYTGPTQGFDTTSTPDGWTVKNNTADGGWQFDDAGKRGNRTGGSGGFAIVDSDHLGQHKTQDTELVSPVLDFSSNTNPEVGFNSYFAAYSGSAGDVDLSLDGGKTWANAWHTTATVPANSRLEVPLTAAAGRTGVQVRFHYTGTWALYWELDNIFFGSRSCDPVHGGLVVGRVIDANTHQGINGATVASADKPAEKAASAPADPKLGDGFYWLFSTATGGHQFTASKAHYTGSPVTVDVATSYTTRADLTLKAGRLAVTPGTINKKLGWGGQATTTLTVRNTGGEKATLKLAEQPGGFTQQVAGAPLQRTGGTFTAGRMAGSGKAGPRAAGPADSNPAADAWTPVADFPTLIQDNAVGFSDGKLYSAFGYNGGADTADTYAYDPATGAWTKLASAADTREAPAHGFINGRFYAVGGWGVDSNPDPKLEIYDPAANNWSTGTASPKPYAGSGSAVLGGKLYVVGGCTTTCGTTDVLVYDVASDSWTQAAAYPEPTSWESCGGIAGKLYCAGGTGPSATSRHGYVYDPGTDSWSPIADLPIDLWGAGYAAANGLLLVSAGVTANSSQLTNQGYAYNPSADAWTPLPNANNTLYRGGSALGFFRVGGSPGGQFAPPDKKIEVLAGYDQSDRTDVSWLTEDRTELTLASGETGRITVTLDAGVAEVTQPGDFTAALGFQTDTPYQVAPAKVTMHVNPPKTWGKITGTVQGLDAKGNAAPIAGATVQINTWATSYTLKTDKNGHYALWLDVRNNPLDLIIAKDGFQPQSKQVKITKGQTLTASFTLKKG